ncbi:unnamed protein product [Rangifer tarandus platyrhynchus]|uniref:Uncharacterized protein n=2 Tax=Rangifer tarandus platyrhynchus TaxID=3082113 RepID=A0AC59ZWR1_RANTA|nr:unnamed protein product [Rangifer tarandus platyrhynchus]
MLQRPAVTFLDSRDPFHRQKGFPGSQPRGVEPLATVLTAGGTKQSTPHHCRLAHCSHQKVKAKMLINIVHQDGRHKVRMQHSRSQPYINQKPLCSFQDVLINFLVKWGTANT